MEDKSRLICPLLRSFILVTVASFATRHTELRGWLTQHAYRSLAPYSTILPRVSGFSTIWFSKVSTDTKERFRTDVGQAWTCILRSSMVGAVMAMREEYRLVPPVPSSAVGDQGSSASPASVPSVEHTPPLWLTELTDSRDGVRSAGAKLTAAVHKVVSEEEGTGVAIAGPVGDAYSELSGSGSGSRRKRQKTSLVPEEQKPEGEIVLKRLYSSIRTYLGGTRTACRLVLFSELLFLTQKINSFESQSAASEAGYRISFGEKAGAAENNPGNWGWGPRILSGILEMLEWRAGQSRNVLNTTIPLSEICRLRFLLFSLRCTISAALYTLHGTSRKSSRTNFARPIFAGTTAKRSVYMKRRRSF